MTKTNWDPKAVGIPKVEENVSSTKGTGLQTTETASKDTYAKSASDSWKAVTLKSDTVSEDDGELHTILEDIMDEVEGAASSANDDPEDAYLEQFMLGDEYHTWSSTPSGISKQEIYDNLGEVPDVKAIVEASPNISSLTLLQLITDKIALTNDLIYEYKNTMKERGVTTYEIEALKEMIEWTEEYKRDLVVQQDVAQALYENDLNRMRQIQAEEEQGN